MEFKEFIKECVRKFCDINKNETIRVISHLDSDGICSAAILTKAMIRERKKFSITFVNYLSEDFIRRLSEEEYNCFLFLDLGTSHIKNIEKYMKGKRVVVLDHHIIRSKNPILNIVKDDDNNKILENKKTESNLIHLNPNFFGINGSKEISGAGVVYYFVKELNSKNSDLAYMGIIGAIGDSQENNGFIGLNNDILKDAISSKKITLERGVRFFGADNMPLYKVLKNSVDIYIPGVTGNDDKAIDFLTSIKIEPKQNNRWTRLNDLKDEELKRLIESIMLRRNTVGKNIAGKSKEMNNDKIFGNRYILNGAESDIKDLRELSTILNACGKLDKASCGLGLLLGDKRSLIKATYTLKEYKREILKSIKWIESKKRTKNIIEDKGYMIINAENNISSEILGTIISMFTRNYEFEKGRYLLSLSKTRNKKIKISFRVVGNNSKTSLLTLLEKMIKPFNGECGGHFNAAGGIIDMKDGDKFIENVINELSKKAMEEVVE
ncbi:MAG: DHH family phosphoesterase [Candidatus Woesearchaeota archaeon]